MENQQKENNLGILAGIGAYIIWGLLPLYWKMAAGVTDLEILAYRIVWSFGFMVLLILVFGKTKIVITEIRNVLHRPKTTLAISAATILITMNWFIFIFSVNSNHIASASLGYYINPIINVLIATLFLKEKLSRGETIAVLTATIGVLLLTWSQGTIPWPALGMAITFSLYGLLKKLVPVSTWTGLTLETMLITPFALIYLFAFAPDSFMSFGLNLNLVLLGTGVVTAIPLLLFAASAQRIPYTMLGFIQYIGPTIMLIIAVFVYNETFSLIEFVSFIFIWIALAIFTSTNIMKAAKTSRQSK